MTNQDQVTHRLVLFSEGFAIAGMLLATLVMLGWAFDVPSWQSFHPSLTGMSAITAVCVMLCGTALLLLQRKHAPGINRLGLMLGGLVSGFALVKLLDGRLFPEIVGVQSGAWGPGGTYPTAMADYTATSLMLLGASLMLMSWETQRGYSPAQFFSLASISISLFVLIGYALDVQSIVHGTPDFPMALNTALALTLLNASALCARPDRGPMNVLSRETPGGHLLRILLPVFLLIPFILGWLRLQGERLGLYETWFGVALMTALMGGSFIAVTWWNAHELDKKELERERAAKALKRREEEYKALAEHSPDIIARFDADLRYIYVNSALSTYAGAATSTLLGKQSEALPAPVHQFSAWDGDIHAVFHTKAPRTVEFSFQPSDGDPLTFQARLVPEPDVDGSVKSVLVVSRDITALRRAYEDLKQADRHKDQFLAIVSHELRTPLNFVMGFLSFLQEGVGGELNNEQQAYADKAMHGAERLLGLVSDLVEYARILSGKLVLDVVPTPYGQLIDETLEHIRATATEKQIELAAAYEFTELVCLDAYRIAQVLDKVLDNAVKFTPEGGRIRVHAYTRDGAIVTEVSDTGPGISLADQAHIFAHFRQADMSSTRASGGLGLGLAISKAIVEAHGGTMGVSSQVGQGSTFWFTLPDRPEAP